ncbi:MAG: class I SAM-dependent methyltransferase [Tannerella sp.]|jgi:hypothetical protein|nr:class I SAM-dependent methyltransferase [Tannerella sp.]
MEVSEHLFSFIRVHAADDVSQLLLSAGRYPDVDVPFAAEQIAARQHIRGKLPHWEADGKLLFPSRTAAEQCSSELTARYKQRLLEGGERHLCDLTGGLGVDAYYFARRTPRVTYVECDGVCFDTAMYNFERLNVRNIAGYNADARDVLDKISQPDVFYIDPARRGAGNTRVFALRDCRPDLEEMLPELLRRAPRVIAKLSPMLDIRHTLTLLPATSEIHVVSVRNECRELLFVARRGAEDDDPFVHCVNFTSNGGEQTFGFHYQEEQKTEPLIHSQVQAYLYEPNASILKAGAYRLTAKRYGVAKLHASSHLYTSDQCLHTFPGRIFRVERVFAFNNAFCRTIARDVPQANLAARNFPLTVNELRKRIRVADGGDAFLFATTLAGNGKVVILCRKAV